MGLNVSGAHVVLRARCCEIRGSRDSPASALRDGSENVASSFVTER